MTIIDSENRVLMYSISKGELVWRFFGNNAAINSTGSTAVVENFPGQLGVYDLSRGEKIRDLVFPRSIVYATFNPDGSRLFVLTESQSFYIFDAQGLATKPPQAL